MITSRSKWRPANRSFMPLNSLIVGPFLPNHYCNPLALAICTRAAHLSRRSCRYRSYTGAAQGRDGINMVDTSLGRAVQVGHFGQRAGRRVVERESLEERATKDFFRRLQWKPRQSQTVAQYDEPSQTACEVRFRVPGNLFALVSFVVHAHAERSRWQRRVGHR